MSHKCCSNHDNYINKENLNEYLVVNVSREYDKQFAESFENGKKYPELLDLMDNDNEIFIIDTKTGVATKSEQFFFDNYYQKFYAVKNE